jgi:hypothetical protein
MESAVGAIDSGESFGGDAKEALGTAAALGSGIAEKRRDVALGLKTIKSGVNGADGNVAVDARFNFVANGDAVGFIAEAKKGEENDVLEFTEEVAGRHYLYIIEEMVEWSTGSWGGEGGMADLKIGHNILEGDVFVVDFWAGGSGEILGGCGVFVVV